MRTARLSFRRSLGSVLVPVALFGLVYLSVSASFAAGEWLYAIVACAAATGFTRYVSRLADMEQRMRFAWARHLVRPTVDVLLQVGPMTLALGRASWRRRRVTSATSRRGFDPGAPEVAEDRGRRALVTMGISITPASLVCTRDVDSDHLTIKRVGIAEQASADRNDRWPI